jgi:2OG-Fe dioxygenase
MSLSDQGFTVVDLSPISPAILDSFHGCAPVGRAGQVTWYRRALRFHITWTADDDWFYELVDAGAEPRKSVVRFRDIDFTPLLRAALGHVWLDLSVDWLIELNQVRTVVPTRQSGPALPLGQQTDAAEVVLIVVAQSQGLAGSEIRLSAPGEQEPCWQATIAPGQALLITRPDLTYDLDAGHASDDGGGIQDTLVITMTRSVARGATLLRYRAAS